MTLKLLVPALFAAVLLTCSVRSTYAQVTIHHKTFANYLGADVVSVAQMRDTVYAAIVGGTVARFDKGFEYLGTCQGLSGRYVSEVFVFGDHVLARTADGVLLAHIGNDLWQQLATVQGATFLMDAHTLFYIENGLIKSATDLNGAIETAEIGRLAVPYQVVYGIAVVGDTLILTSARSTVDPPSVSILLLSGGVVDTSDVEIPWSEQYFGLSDGGIVCHKRSRTSVLMPGSVVNPVLREVGMPDNAVLRGLSLSAAVVVNGELGAAGVAAYGRESPLETESVVYIASGTLLNYVSTFDSVARKLGPVSYHANTWIHSYGIGKFAVSEGGAPASVADKAPYTPASGHVFIPNLENNEPRGVATLGIAVGGSPVLLDGTETFVFPFEQSETVPREMFMGYNKVQDGSECAMFEKSVWVRMPFSTEWTCSRKMSDAYYNPQGVQFYAPSTVVLQESDSLHYSADNGTTWKSMANGPEGVLDVIASGGFITTAGTAFRRYAVADTEATEPISQINYAAKQDLFKFVRADSETATFVCARSAIINNPNLKEFEFITVGTWNTEFNSIDSAMIKLQNPIVNQDGDEMYACMFNDTIHILSNNATHMISIYNNQVVKESKLHLVSMVGVEDVPTRTLLANNGIWWLCYESNNVAVGIDLGDPLTTNVSNETPNFERKTSPLTIFPNPASTYINVCFEGAVSVLEVNGRIADAPVQRTSVDNWSIDVSMLACGQYFVVGRDGATNKVRAFTKH